MEEKPAAERILSAGVEAGKEYLGALGGKYGTKPAIEKPLNVLSGRGSMRGAKRDEILDIERGVGTFRESELQAAPMMFHQLGADSQLGVRNRLGMQSRAMSGPMSERERAQRETQVRWAIRSQYPDLPVEPDDIMLEIGKQRENLGTAVEQTAQDVLDRKVKGVTKLATGRGLQPGYRTAAGQARTRDAKVFNMMKTEELNTKYDLVDKMAEVEKPIYDYAPVKQTFERLAVPGWGQENEVMGQVLGRVGRSMEAGDPLLHEVIRSELNVLPPEGKLAAVSYILQRLDNTQDNWRVGHVLRSKAGEAIREMPWEKSWESGQAKQVWKSLNEMLRNPVNGAEQTVAAEKAATAAAKDFYDKVSNPTYKMSLELADSPELVAKKFAADPTLLNPEYMQTIYEVGGTDNLAAWIRQEIITSPEGAVTALNRWEKEAGQQFGQVVTDRGTMMRLAKQMDQATAALDSTTAQLLNPSERAKRLLVATADGPNATRTTMRAVNPTERRVYRMAALDHVFGDSLKVNQHGDLLVNPKVLQERYLEAKSKGWFREELLNSVDEARLKGLIGYAKRTTTKGDVGATLEAAQAYTQVKNPFNVPAFMNGVHKIGVNKMVGLLMIAPKQGKLWRWYSLGKDGAKAPLDIPALRGVSNALIAAADYVGATDYMPYAGEVYDRSQSLLMDARD